ncbi:MAG TPA: hypothetical protein VFA59_06640 [Vicinamibacterales bacterium]|nr:hypothetical protein [Vicinamibacterales bacterium]
MDVLTREQLLAAAQAVALPIQQIDVPELGGSVIVRGMSAHDRDAFEGELMNARRRRMTLENVRARLAVRCLVDGAGQRLFTDEDVVVLGGLRADVMDRVCTVAQRLSGFVTADLQELAKSEAES